MVDADDWRLQGQETYLRGETLHWRTWVRPRESWDHDHCEFCWATFSDHPGEDDCLREGWATGDNYRWVCDDCRQDFSEMFEWTLVRPEL